MIALRSFVGGRWRDADGSHGGRQTLVNPATEEPVAQAGTGNIDFHAAVTWARDNGGPALREMTFAQRAELLRAMSKTIHAHREELLAPSIENAGTTRSDSKFDIDGAWSTLSAYADLGAQLGDRKTLTDGDGIQLGRSPRWFGQHVLQPREGVAVQVNAFNFPAWGFAEKAALALLAGMPVIWKPATATALPAFRVMELLVEAKVLPDGAVSFVAGSAGDLLRHLGPQDVLGFTGSHATALELRALPNLLAASVHVNVEADSLNAAVLAPGVERGSPTWDSFVSDVVREMTQKTGQKCTAFRRIFAPQPVCTELVGDLADRLSTIVVGNPADESVKMGPLVSAAQLRDVRDGIHRLRAEAAPVYGGDGAIKAVGAPAGKGYFIGPVLLECTQPDIAEAVHSHEVFGPVSTLMPYDDSVRSVARLVARGGGMLQTSLYGDDRTWLSEAVRAIGPYVGRLFIGSAKIAGQTTSPGTALPQLVHGGPGRAGGGEELGGLRGLSLYLQRTALQGDKAILDHFLGH